MNSKSTIHTKEYTNKKDYLAIILIALASIIVYYNSIAIGFYFDDTHMITSNPLIRDIKYIPKFFTSPYISPLSLSKGMLRPLLMISFLYNYYCGKLNPVGYHITNILLHIGNGILIFFLLRILLREEGDTKTENNKNYSYFAALFASLLFAVHPINTETVSYISCRSSLMFSFFLLLCLFFHINRHLYRGKKRLILSMSTSLCFILALLSKETAIVIPLILILYDYIFIYQAKLKEMFRESKGYYLTFFIVAILYILWRKHLYGAIASIRYIRDIYSNILIQLYAACFYFKLFFYPVNLCITHTPKEFEHLYDSPVLVSSIILFILLILAFIFIRRKRLFSFAVFFFFINLIPMFIGVLCIPITEHHFYLPSVALYIILSIAIISFFKKMVRNELKIIACVLLIIILIFSSLGTIRRNNIWQDRYNLWADAVRVSPLSVAAQYNLGMECFWKGKHNKAIGHFNKVLEIYKSFGKDISPALEIELRNKLFTSYIATESYSNAMKEAKLLINLSPSQGYNLMGFLYLKKGLVKKAIRSCRKAIKADPTYSLSYHNISLCYKLLNPPDIKLSQKYLNLAEKYGYQDDIDYLFHLESPEINSTK